MKILDFYKRFPTEESCRKEYKELREKKGIRCKKCGCYKHYWKKNRQQWECKECKHRTGLRADTVMQSSKLPFHYWFIAMHLITSSKKSFSAKELQRQLGHKRYQPIWEMLHKLRLVMGSRDEEYTLGEEVEVDEGFFETVSITRDKNKALKRGRGSQRQTTVLVSAESKQIENPVKSKKYSTYKKVRYIKMRVIDSLKKDDMTETVRKQIEEGSIIKTDASNSYNDLKDTYQHQAVKSSKETVSTHLPWVHIVISNAKKLLLNTYHRIDDDFLQSYLNEFCFKFNRRYFDSIFDRLLNASTLYRWNYLGQ